MNDIKRRTDWFSKAGFGLFIHYSTLSLPEHGEKKDFFDAVRDFDVDKFVYQASSCGAKFVFITASHTHMMLPFPLKEMDDIVPNHTAKRDLISELSDKLEKNGIKLMLYFNGDGSCDKPWQDVTHFEDNQKLHAEYCYRIAKAISDKYGKKIHGWWIDCCYDNYLAPHDKIGRGHRYDYARYADALRSGNPDSIVAFNFRGTTDWGCEWGIGISDFQAGEENGLDHLPKSRFDGEGGSQWFALCWMDKYWVNETPGEPVPVHKNEDVLKYVKEIKKHGGVFAYNCAVYQEGYISDKTFEQLMWLKEHGIDK